MSGYRRVAVRERDERRSKSKTRDLAWAELSSPDPRQALKKRLCKEMDALRGILRKAELVVRKSVDKSSSEPHRGKDGRFLAAKARSEADHTPCAKRRKATPAVETIEPLPRISKADPIPCAKKRRTTPPPMEMEITEPRISKDEIFSLVTRLSSLSSNMPVRVVEFLHKECTGHTDEKASEIEIDLGSMKRSVMFELHKLLDEFSEEDKRRQQKEDSINVCRSISRSFPPEIEEGEFIKEDCDASLVVARKGLRSPPGILGEKTEEKSVICSNSGPVATAETAKCPSNSSSSGSSSSSDGTSGSSFSDSSNSDSSDSDSASDDECVTSNVAQAVLSISKTDASPMLAKGLCSPPRIEDGEMTEEEVVDISGDASPIATEKFVESAKSPSNNSSSSSSSGSSSSGSSSSGSSSCSCSDSSDSDSSDSGECVTSNAASAVLPKTDTSHMAMPHKVLSPIAEEEFAETRNSRRSNSSLLEDGEIEEEQESPIAAKKFAEIVNTAGSTNGQCVRSSPAPAVHPKPPNPQPAAQGTVPHFSAKGFDKKQGRAVTAQGTVRQLYDKAFEKKRELERKRAYEKLEEMERNAKAKPIFDWIHPGHLKQLGITTPVEYAVTSERRLPARRGCPVQSLLGLFLKAE